MKKWEKRLADLECRVTLLERNAPVRRTCPLCSGAGQRYVMGGYRTGAHYEMGSNQICSGCRGTGVVPA